MADVIGCQQKSPGAICIFVPEYPNTCDAAKQQPHQEFTGVIRFGFGFGLHRLSVSLNRRQWERLFFRLIPFWNVIS